MSPDIPEAQRNRPRARPRRSERGQSLVEFSFVLPIFLVIVMATIDFGWALRSYMTLTNAAREGARLGSTGASTSAIKTRTVDRASGLISLTDVTVSGAASTPGNSVTVTIDYDYTYITPLGGLVSMISSGALPSPLPITTTTVMRLE